MPRKPPPPIRIHPRLPGLAIVGASLLGMAFLSDPAIQMILFWALAMVLLVAWMLNEPAPGTLPAVGAGPAPVGSVMVGHARATRSGGGVSIPWAEFRHGLAVEGSGDPRSEFVAGIALQATAAGRPVILLDLAGGYGLAEPFLRAAEEAHLGDDVWIFGGPEPTVSLDLFDGVPTDLIPRLVSDACRFLDGPEPASVLARLLLPAAQALFDARTSDRLAETPSARTIGFFEDCLGLAALEGFLEHTDIVQARNDPDAAGAVARYLLAIPGYSSGPRQPSTVAAAHSAAANVLKDGLGVLRRICGGTAPPVGPRDIVAPGRACVFRRHPGAASWHEAVAILDVLSEEIRSSARLRPLVAIDGIDALPVHIAARVVGLRVCGAILLAGHEWGRPVPGFVDWPEVTTARIVLPQSIDGPARLRFLNGRTRTFHPLPLDRPPALLAKPEATPGLVRIPDPPSTDAQTLAYLTLLTGFLDMPDTPHENPALEPSPLLDRYAKRVASVGDQGMDRIAAHVLAGEPDPVVDPLADPFGEDTDPGAEEGLEDLDLDIDFGAPFALGGKGFDFGGFDPPAADDEAGHVVFPASIQDDPDLSPGPWHRVAGMRLLATPGTWPDGVSLMLDEEFPHFAEATHRIVRLVSGSAGIHARPLLLHGPRGIGKTRYARRLCELTRRSWSLYPCGSSPDTAFVGASRQWSGARPGYATAQVARQRICDPTIILDAIDAVPQGANHAAFYSGVTALLDAETAPRYHDPYLDAKVDLSRISWIATATDIERLPDGFVELFDVVALPAPGESDMLALVMALVGEAPVRPDADPREVPEVADAVRGRWKGGSVRVLRAHVAEALSERRDRLAKVGG